jgi:hypothetical protein
MNSIFINAMIYGIYSSPSICKSMTDRIQKLKPSQRLYLRDEEERDWGQALFTGCLLSYLDKQFYECMEQVEVNKKNENVPQMLMNEYEFISSRNRKWNSYAISQRQVLIQLDRCLEMSDDALENMHNRTSYPKYTDKDFEGYRRITLSLSQKESQMNVVSRNDTQPTLQSKIDSVTQTLCNDFKPPLVHYSVPPTQIVNARASEYEYHLCLTAQLCANRLKECLSKEEQTHKGIFDCITDPSIFQCYLKENSHTPTIILNKK